MSFERSRINSERFPAFVGRFSVILKKFCVSFGGLRAVYRSAAGDFQRLSR